MNNPTVNDALGALDSFIGQSNALRSLVILMLSIAAAYLLSHFVGRFIIWIGERVTAKPGTVGLNKTVHVRRVETYLSVTVALVRAVIVGFVAFYVWQILSPVANFTAAAIGAGAFFAILAGSTISILLRDITAGATIIAERWFNVGDFIRLIPYGDVSGVVERMTLRSTRMRSINGEVIWIHNQHIQGVHVTESGLRTMAVDIFVKNEASGKKLIAKAIEGMPVDSLAVAQPLTVTRNEQWADSLWVITVTGQTLVGREWLIEDYFVESLKELDDKIKKQKILARQPIVRDADPEAERSFRRTVRAMANNKNQQKT